MSCWRRPCWGCWRMTEALHQCDDLYLGSTYSYPITYTDNSNTSPVSAGGGSIVISTLNGVTLPWVYCVGLYTDVYVSADYDKTVVTNNGYVNGSLVTNAGNIAYLLDTYATAYAGNTHEEASLQAAIWQIEYGASSSPGTGVVIQSVVGGDLTLFNTLLTAGRATAPLDTIRWLSPKNSSSTVYQGLVTIGTPEPSTLAISQARRAWSSVLRPAEQGAASAVCLAGTASRAFPGPVAVSTLSIRSLPGPDCSFWPPCSWAWCILTRFLFRPSLPLAETPFNSHHQSRPASVVSHRAIVLVTLDTRMTLTVSGGATVLGDEPRTYDLIVIGGGPAGINGATTARILGKSVALVDRHHELGGAGEHRNGPQQDPPRDGRGAFRAAVEGPLRRRPLDSPRGDRR